MEILICFALAVYITIWLVLAFWVGKMEGKIAGRRQERMETDPLLEAGSDAMEKATRIISEMRIEKAELQAKLEIAMAVARAKATKKK